MMLPQRSFLPKSGCTSSVPSFAFRSRNKAICKAEIQKPVKADDVTSLKGKGVAAATLAASILFAAAVAPGDALAARSGGRAGGSSFRSAAPRSAPSAGPTIQNRTYNNYNMSPAPPLIGGYGFGGGYGYGYGGGGISLFPTFVSPIGGGIFQLFFFAIIASTLISVASSLFGKRRQDDEWDK